MYMQEGHNLGTGLDRSLLEIAPFHYLSYSNMYQYSVTAYLCFDDFESSQH